ncbi:putative ribonuclease H-like domain-containing protein [Tanacetum coccineum]
MHDTGIFGNAYDDEDVEEEVDMNNVVSSYRVLDAPFTKFLKDHPKDQVIGSLKTPVQTRHMTKINDEHGLISSVHKLRRTNHKDFQNCLFAYFLSQMEPKKPVQALKDPSWVEAMHDELLQFKLLKVWTLVDLPRDKWATGTKWVFRNKKDERGIVVKNKARLVAQGHTQEEGIDYDEVFAPVARIKAIRLFFAYASFKDFVVYQMDVKSAFLYGKIEEEVYVCQPPDFEDPNFPDKVYKVEKALYGLHQAPRAWYETLSTYLLDNGFHRGQIDKTLFIKRHKDDILLVHVYVDDIIFGSTKKKLSTEFEKLMHDKFQMSSMGELSFFLGLQVQQKSDGIFLSQNKYVAEILKKFDFATVKTTSTPIEPNKALIKDEEAEDVDVHLYRSMIGSLMYLTASRSDITFDVCACARFQVTPKTSHLHAVKRIFRYLKGQRKLGLWYLRDSPFDLEAFSDSDYAGASLDRKSTTGGCQFLGKRLISWQCKKQTIVANSTTEAEYVAAVNYCGQSRMDERTCNIKQKCVKSQIPRQVKRGQDTKIPQYGGPPEKVGDEAVHKELGDKMEMAATTVTSLDAGQGSGNINKTPSMPYDLPLLRGHTLRSDEDRMQQHELMDLVIKLPDRYEALETDLRQTKKVYSDAFTRLIKKVKKLEQTVKTIQARRRLIVVISDDAEDDLEDSSKQGRMIEEIDQDAGVTLVTPTHSQEVQPEDQLGVFSSTKVLADAAKNVHTYTRRRRAVSTGSGGVSTASRLFSIAEESVSTAGASMPVSTAGMVQEVNKDKGKGIMIESEPEQTKTKLQQRQERAGYEAAVRLQEQLDEEAEDQRICQCMKKLVLSILKNGKIYKLQLKLMKI